MSEPACPICAKPAVDRYKPFCSKRCADVDLSRWLKGSYAIPGSATEDPDDEPARPETGPNSEE
ncbi:MAG: DNA gyrase inhibitor YacG [Alphaproteobacteria bacterium]|nr:DNA gyrase inhibitor YacG [Alphaproteobacteria bacterium]